MLDSWTYDRPLPTLETIGDEDEDVYDALLDGVDGVNPADVETNFDVQPGKGDADENPTGK